MLPLAVAQEHDLLDREHARVAHGSFQGPGKNATRDQTRIAPIDDERAESAAEPGDRATAVPAGRAAPPARSRRILPGAQAVPWPPA